MLFSVIGNYSLILGLFFGLFLFYFSAINFRNSKVLDTKILSFTFLQFFLVVISFLCLVLSFVISDFSNETVFNNSHTAKPIFYKVAGTWGNHEGSLLLWLLVLTLFILIFLIRTKNQPVKYRVLTLVFQQIIIIGFFIFLIKTSNPFNHIYPIPTEGLGLNPITNTPPCVNDKDAVPGGSSSGAAASVAFNLAPAGIGSDTGGSVRIPAAWNDLVGLKTTLGRLSVGGSVPLNPDFDTIGPLCKSVEDASNIFNALEGKDLSNIKKLELKNLKFMVLTTSLN